MVEFLSSLQGRPSGQNRQKTSLKDRVSPMSSLVSLNSALKIQCHVVKNTLLAIAILV